MKKRRRWLLTGGIALATLTLVVLRWPGVLEPWQRVLGNECTYQGRSASEWVQALKAPDPHTRWRTLAALNFMEAEGETPVPILQVALKNDDADVRSLAAQCLGGLGPDATAAIPDLVRALEDPSEDVRLQAASALSWMGDDATAALNPLVARLHDPSPRVREAAVVCLATMGQPATSAVPSLLDMARNPQERESNKKRAAMALWKLDPATAVRENIPEPQTSRVRTNIGG